jgi:hypothetical protein
MQATRKAADVEPKRKKSTRKTAFVPGVVFTTAVAGVVPACVIGCSSNGSGGTTPPGVANCAFAGNSGNCATVAAVGYVAFDAGDGGHSDAPSEAQADVATDAMQAGDGTASDAAGDAADDAAGDAKGD